MSILNPINLIVFMMQAMLMFATGVAWFTHDVLAWVVSSDFLKLSFTTGGIVSIGWPLMRDFANVGFVFALVVISLATALRYRDYEAKKLLPALIGIILLINFTPVICGLILDPFNILMNFFLSQTSGLNMVNLVVNDMASDVIGEIATFIIGVPRFDLMIKVPILICVVLFYAGILLVFGMVFLLRYIAIWVLVIISPLAFFAFVLPPTRKYFSSWWSMFWHWTLVGTITAFFLYLGDQFTIVFTTSNIISPPSFNNVIFGAMEGFLGKLVVYWFLELYFFFALTTSISMSGIGSNAIVATVKQWGGQAAGWVGQRVKKAGKEAALSAGRSIVSSESISGTLNRLATTKQNAPFGSVLRWAGRKGLSYQAGVTESVNKMVAEDKEIDSLAKAGKYKAIAAKARDAWLPEQRIKIASVLAEKIGGRGIDQLTAVGLGTDFYARAAREAAERGDLENLKKIIKNNPLLAKDPQVLRGVFRMTEGKTDPYYQAIAKRAAAKGYTGNVDDLANAWNMKRTGKRGYDPGLATQFENFAGDLYLEEAMRGLTEADVEKLDATTVADPEFRKAFALVKGQSHLSKGDETFGPDFTANMNEAAASVGSWDLARNGAVHWLRGPLSNRKELYDPMIVMDANGQTFNDPSGKVKSFNDLDAHKTNEYIRYAKGRGPRPSWMGPAPAGGPPAGWTPGPGGLPIAPPPAPSGGPTAGPAPSIRRTTTRPRTAAPSTPSAPASSTPRPSTPRSWTQTPGGLNVPPAPPTPPPYPPAGWTSAPGGTPVMPKPAPSSVQQNFDNMRRRIQEIIKQEEQLNLNPSNFNTQQKDEINRSSWEKFELWDKCAGVAAMGAGMPEKPAADHVRLYRGLTGTYAYDPKQPVTFWTDNVATAIDFAKGGEVIAVDVPRSESGKGISISPMSGLGQNYTGIKMTNQGLAKSAKPIIRSGSPI